MPRLLSSHTQGKTMNRVTGIGGIFFKAKDQEALLAWYRKHLGIDVQVWGGVVFRWQSPNKPIPNGGTAWSIFPANPDYFAPSTAYFMLNYRVEHLHEVLAVLRKGGCEGDATAEVCECGNFRWVMDREGNRVDLCGPPAGE